MQLHSKMVTSFTVYLKIVTLYPCMDSHIYFTFPCHSPLQHYNEYCIVRWCLTKFTLL